MKTTIELPDALLIEAKSVAARRRTTLRALVEHALRREIEPGQPVAAAEPEAEFLEEMPDGFVRLKQVPGQRQMTSEDVRRIMDEEGI